MERVFIMANRFRNGCLKRHLVTLYMTFFTLLFTAVFLPESNAEEPSMSSNDKKITMVFTKTKTEYTGRWTYLIFSEAFRRLGKELIFETYPPNRCSVLADEGRVDGELGRIYSYAENHPNLVRVEEPITSVYWSAYTIDPTIKIDGWESMRGTDYKVEYRHGMAKPKNKLSEIVKKENLSHVNTVTHALKKLIAGRTDIYIDIEGSVEQSLASKDFEDTKIRKAGILEEETIHAYLHKKNKSYAQPLSNILKRMKYNGFFEAYETIVKKETATTIVTGKLMNGGFEEEKAGKPDYWKFFGLRDSILVDEHIQAQGNHSIQIYLRKPSTEEVHLQQEVDVEAGKRYDFGGKLKVRLKEGWAKIMVIFLDAKRNEIETRSLPQLVDNTDWVYQNAWIKSPNGADKAKIICVVKGSGKAWFDDIHFSTKIRGGY